MFLLKKNWALFYTEVRKFWCQTEIVHEKVYDTTRPVLQIITLKIEVKLIDSKYDLPYLIATQRVVRLNYTDNCSKIDLSTK